MPHATPHPALPIADQSPPRRCPSSVLAAILAHATERPRSVAIAEFGASGDVERTITYSQLASRAGALAEALRDHSAPDAVVMLIGSSGPDLALWIVASLMAGVSAFPVPIHTIGREIDDLARRSRAALLVGDGSLAPAGLPRIKWDRAACETDDPPTHPIEFTRDSGPGSIVLHSSGTTGLSKLALRDMASLDADAANIVHGTRLTADDRVLMVTPLSHSYGIDLLVASLLAGSALHTTRTFDPAAIAAHLATQATVFPAVPFVFEALAGLSSTRRCPQLRLILSAGASLPPEVRRAFEDAWRIRIGDLYGATELGTVTLNIPGSPLHLDGSVGTALPGVSIRIVDPDDPARELPPRIGREGHIVIAAPSMLSRYLDGEMPLTDGHLLTGDLGRIDQLGRLFITGRLKLLIDACGIKINPLEIEAALRTHPGVAECVVVPYEISGTISRLRAVFVPRDPARTPSAEELRSFLRERVSAPKIPRVFEPVPALPKTSTGKILRSAILGPPA